MCDKNQKEEQLNIPFLLRPAGKDYLWGGSRLNDDFAKNIAMHPLAETWECSTHPDGPSVIASGSHCGERLDLFLKEHPTLLGTHPRTRGELPVLIKFIDASKDLSVQVHPDDVYASQHENGQQGKTEMWYVLDAAPGSELIYGLNKSMSAEQLRSAVEDGSIEKHLQRVPIHQDDLFFVEPGTIHAIGQGALIAEIQQNSNLTYRLYDYDRVDKDGKKRELHLEKALQVANLEQTEMPKQPLRVMHYERGCARELLSRCKYFEVYRILLNTERCREMVSYQTDALSFHVFLCTKGCGQIFPEGSESIPFFRGDCIFFPAASKPVKWHGNARLLEVRC